MLTLPTRAESDAEAARLLEVLQGQCSLLAMERQDVTLQAMTVQPFYASPGRFLARVEVSILPGRGLSMGEALAVLDDLDVEGYAHWRHLLHSPGVVRGPPHRGRMVVSQSVTLQSVALR